jgi:tetratricopeptide (TPR) repeat protein
MNQGDLFNLIVKLNFAKQIDIARAICDSSNQMLNTSDIQTCVNRAIKGRQNGKPIQNIIEDNKIEEFVDKLFHIIFKDCDSSNGANPKAIEENYKKIKEYLKINQLCFHNDDELIETSADCSTFIKCMMQESLKRHEAHSKEESTYTGTSSSSPMLSNYMPKLHSQKIYCPNKFYSRASLLDDMKEKLNTYKIVILYGIGGIGKTYLSRQYAHINSSLYNCEQIVTYDKLSSSIKKTILSLQFDDLLESEMNDDDKFEKRMSLLNNMSDNTLLIIDNIDTHPIDLKYFDELCMNSGIHIIITTRLTDCFSPVQTIEILPMPVNDQLDFFKYHYSDSLSEKDIPVVEDILKCIDGHTLLIELVAKSMRAGALSPSQMLDYLKGNKQTELLPVSINKDNLSSEKKTMSDYIKLLFDVGYLDPKAKEALLYLSLLPVEGVSRRFIYNLLPKFKDSFNELISNSWAIEDRSGQSIRLHPVIRDMIRDEMNPSISNCIYVMSNLHSSLQTSSSSISDSDKRDICRILGSINEIDGFYENCTNVTMLTFFAEFCFKEYKFDLALHLYKTASKVASDSPIQTVTAIYLQIGDVYKRLASYDESISAYKSALASNSQLQPCADKCIQEATIYERLSDIYRKDSQYEKAMQYNDSAISIYKNPDNNATDTQLAEIYNRRGIIYLNKSDTKNLSASEINQLLCQALECYQKGLSIREKCNDTKRQLAYSYHNVGTAYHKLGEYSFAIENHKKALQLRKESQNVPKTDIASSHVWLGNDYMALDESCWDLAKEHFEESLKIREEILGKTHPEVAWSLISLSEWYEKKKVYVTALEYAKRADSIRSAVFAPSHNYVVQIKDRINKLQLLINQ